MSSIGRFLTLSVTDLTLSHRTIERDQLASRLEDEGAVRHELEAQVESMTQQLETMANEIEDNDTKVSPARAWCEFERATERIFSSQVLEMKQEAKKLLAKIRKLELAKRELEDVLKRMQAQGGPSTAEAASSESDPAPATGSKRSSPDETQNSHLHTETSVRAVYKPKSPSKSASAPIRRVHQSSNSLGSNSSEKRLSSSSPTKSALGTKNTNEMPPPSFVIGAAPDSSSFPKKTPELDRSFAAKLAQHRSPLNGSDPAASARPIVSNPTSLMDLKSRLLSAKRV